jgi:hypothetical protein
VVTVADVGNATVISAFSAASVDVAVDACIAPVVASAVAALVTSQLRYRLFQLLPVPS